MGDAFIFLETDLVWFVVAAGLLLVGLFLLKEWPRRHRRGFPIRLLAAALAITSLVCLALRPATLRSLDSKSAVILTRGYSEIRLDSLREVHPGIQQIEYHRGRLMALEPVISEVFLLGDGLLPYDFWQLEKERVHFLPPDEMQEGISSIQAIGPIVLGESFSVSGRFERPGTGHRLLLRDPGGNPLDSLLLGNGTASLFRLEGTPKAPGPQTYSLEQRDSTGQLLGAEPVPIVVVPPVPLRILILNTFPTFETKYLKNFLEAKGNSILLRSQLSRGLYKFEYINRDPDPVYELTRELLEEFDLVITDYQAYRRLSPGSRSALEESIAQDGTGLLIQPDDSFFRRSEQDGYFVFESDNLLQLNASKPELVVEKYPYTFANSFPVQPIPLDHYVPAAERPLGNGRVVTTVLRNTYRWLLKGEEAYYEKFWSLLLRRAAARQTPTATWEARTHLPRRDAPFEFRLHTAIPKPEVINQRGARIPMAEDVLVEGVWNGREYPGRTGWNHLRLKGDSLADFPYYVYGEGSWSTRESFATRQANRRQFGRNQLKAERQQAYLPIRPAWFYISFLLSMAWLWLEPRLFGD